MCLVFQKEIGEEAQGKLGKLLAEKEYLENEVHHLKRKISSLENSMSEFAQEILEGLDTNNSGNIIFVASKFEYLYVVVNMFCSS